VLRELRGGGESLAGPPGRSAAGRGSSQPCASSWQKSHSQQTACCCPENGHVGGGLGKGECSLRGTDRTDPQLREELGYPGGAVRELGMAPALQRAFSRAWC